MTIFVTGGAGYIGSHTILALLRAGQDVACFDNYDNSTPIALARIEKLAGKRLTAIIEGDVRDYATLHNAMNETGASSVIHFAGLKAVGESVEKPQLYHDNNVAGSVNLLRAMDETDCKRIVFSSSATVYGVPDYLPYDEDHPINPTNPYGQTKADVEEIIGTWAKADDTRSAALLRYFNPVGADPSGQIGEDPEGIPNNLMPFIAQTAIGLRDEVTIFGNDYGTRDGTGERDYIHVSDLAAAHLAALTYVENHSGAEAFNIGTGQAVTVLEMIHAFEAACGKPIPYTVGERRAGDIPKMLAGVDKANTALGWQATCSLEDMCRSSWHWQSNNPRGYRLG